MSKLIRHLKRVFGIGTQVKPLKMADVKASEQPPAQVEAARNSTVALVGEVVKAERMSWEVRQELAGAVLNLVATGGDGRRNPHGR